MPTEKEVYDGHADQYEKLILKEDHLDNLPEAINKVRDTHGLDIIELGAGTGRLTRFLARQARTIAASDLSMHMLQTARDVLENQESLNVILSVADLRQTPFPKHSADMIIAGWSFCYLAVWGDEKWEQELEAGLAEAKRLLRPGGILILLENYGTGFKSPNPPPHLNDYFDFLKSKDFDDTWIRTDYSFKDMDEAMALSGFFFGEEMAAKIQKYQWCILPECTGILWKIF